MKKILFIMTMVSALLCGCGRLTPENVLVSASFNVSMDEYTKAVADGDGAAGSVNRCILQIWTGDEIYRTEVRTAPAGTREFSFKGVVLNPDETYDFLFWADCGTGTGEDLYYSTESLKNVRMLHPDNGNDDAMDAFCNHLRGCRIDTEYETRLILHRPLAQLNVITGDLSEIAGIALAEEFVPKSVSYSFIGCTGFDVLGNSTVGIPAIVMVKDAPIYGEVGEDGACTLAMAYIFPQSGESVSSVDMQVRSVNDAVISASCDNVPFKTNYRTNIIGNMLTAGGEFSVSISPMFNGEINAR